MNHSYLIKKYNVKICFKTIAETSYCFLINDLIILLMNIFLSILTSYYHHIRLMKFSKQTRFRILVSKMFEMSWININLQVIIMIMIKFLDLVKKSDLEKIINDLKKKIKDFETKIDLENKITI